MWLLDPYTAYVTQIKFLLDSEFLLFFTLINKQRGINLGPLLQDQVKNL